MTFRDRIFVFASIAFAFALGCAGENEPAKERCNTAADCAEGQTCRDFQCAEPTAGTGGTQPCSEQPGAGGDDGLLLGAETCETQCVEAKGTCPDADMGFDCVANCAHTGDQVETADCLVEWDKIFRCGKACGVCALCEPEIRDLQVCFRDFCETDPDNDICVVPQ